MSPEVRSEYARMLAARQRLLDLRSSRIEQLLRLRVVWRGLLADFFETLDPIANVRLAEVAAEGSKAHGDLALTLAFFQGTQMRLAVDTAARFSHAVNVPSRFDDVGRIVEIVVSSDMSRCDVVYEPLDRRGTTERIDMIEATMALLAHAVAAVEAEASEAPTGANVTLPPVAAAAGVVAPPPGAPVARPATPAVARLNVAGRVAGAAAPEAPALRLTLAPIDPPNADVLTFNVG